MEELSPQFTLDPRATERRRRHHLIDTVAAEKHRSARRRRRSKSPGGAPLYSAYSPADGGSIRE